MFKLKEETKEKIKNVWIDAAPFIAVVGAVGAAMALSYDKYLKAYADNNAKSGEVWREQQVRAGDAYVEALERNVFIKTEIK